LNTAKCEIVAHLKGCCN